MSDIEELIKLEPYKSCYEYGELKGRAEERAEVVEEVKEKLNDTGTEITFDLPVEEMTVKEIAKAFGMSVNQLAMISGYSRQGLYDVVEGKANKNTNRFNAFVDHLKFISLSIYEQDLSEARVQVNIRNNLLNQLKEQKRE